jgi:hypothetical protein
MVLVLEGEPETADNQELLVRLGRSSLPTLIY